MDIYIPYVYCIEHNLIKRKYIGCKTGKDANPELFWIKYFTSSKNIKDIIKKEGKEIFSIKWIKIVSSAAEAFEIEEKALKEVNAATNEEYYNCNEGSKNFNPTKANKLKVENGTHHLLRKNGGSEKNKKLAMTRIENGTHNWLDGSKARETQLKRISEGIHQFQNKELQSKWGKISLQRKTHNFLKENGGSEMSSKRNKKLIEEGKHVFLCNNPNKIKVECPHCHKIGGRCSMIRWHFDNCKMKI
jgi:hypothetical protein